MIFIRILQCTGLGADHLPPQDANYATEPRWKTLWSQEFYCCGVVDGCCSALSVGLRFRDLVEPVDIGGTPWVPLFCYYGLGTLGSKLEAGVATGSQKVGTRR